MEKSNERAAVETGSVDNFLGAGFLAGTGENNSGPLAWSMIDFFCGNLGCLACGAFARVGVTIKEWEIGTTDIDSQLMALLDCCCHRSQVDGDPVDLAWC